MPYNSDESGYPPKSFDQERYGYFYDDSCMVEAPFNSSDPCNQCHTVQPFPNVSCVDAATVVISSSQPIVQFTCPGARDTIEVGGLYSLYYGAYWPTDPLTGITCTTSNHF